VNVVFILHTPNLKNNDPPIRIVGNISQLGDTFTDLEGGTGILPTAAKQLVQVGDDLYGLNLSLPVGLDLRYKYTLGDGFWNAELNLDGGFHLRQIIVDGKHPVIEDWVDSWQDKHFGPINFSVTVPAIRPSVTPFPSNSVHLTGWNRSR
jgi:hypothetical protein